MDDLRDLDRAWARLEQAEPPELVDQAVLNAAGRALTRPSPRRRWWGAFATAAVVVLALAVVLQQDWEPAAPPMEELNLRPQQEPSVRRAEPDSAATEEAESDAAEDVVGKSAPALPPERWIERLRQLRSEGDEAAFRRQLAEFRARYPDYPLPPELEN